MQDATGGIYPEEGALRLPAIQLIRDILSLAANQLELPDTNGRVASSDGRDLDPSFSYHHYGLSGEISIDWHAREGSGGNAYVFESVADKFDFDFHTA